MCHDLNVEMEGEDEEPSSVPSSCRDRTSGSCTWLLRGGSRDVVVARARRWPTQLGFPAEEPFAETKKCLQHEFLLARYLTEWAVSFLPCLEGGGGGEQVWRAFPRAGFSKSPLRSWVARRNLCGSKKRTFRLLNHSSTAVLNASTGLLCVCDILS